MKLLLALISFLVLSGTSGFAQPAKARQPSPASQTTGARIDLNSASEEELDRLTGVGPATAKKIIEGRPYTSVSDLQRAGVSQRTIDQIAPLVTVSRSRSRATAPAPTRQPESRSDASTQDSSRPPVTGSKVDLNTASEKDLDELPGVGPATAKKIISGRPYSNIGELSRAGVPQRTIEQITPLVMVSGAPAPASTSTGRSHRTEVPETPRVQERPSPPQDRTSSTSTPTRTEPPAAPARPGMVWVNMDTKVFHREGDRWYGNTKNGRYMSEEEAVRNGYRESKTGGPKK